MVALPAAELRQEFLDQHCDVLGPLAQGGQFDPDYVQPVVEVLAEAAGSDGSLQVLVGCRDDPHVHPPALVGPDGHDLSLLDHVQQLGLGLE